MPDEHSCGFVLFRQVADKRYYLLMHYKAGHWDFPKGHVEENENEEQTARRELEEETRIRRAWVVPGFRYEYVYEFGGAARASASEAGAGRASAPKAGHQGLQAPANHRGGFADEDRAPDSGDRPRGRRSKRVTFMLARTDQSAVRVSHEHQGARWMPYERALGMLTFPNAKSMLEAAENCLKALPPTSMPGPAGR